MKGFLRNRPVPVNPDELKQICQSGWRASGQLACHVLDFHSYASNRFSDVDVSDSNLNARGWTVSVNPIEEHLNGSGEETPLVISKKRTRLMKDGLHYRTVASPYAFVVPVHHINNGVIIADVRRRGAGSCCRSVHVGSFSYKVVGTCTRGYRNPHFGSMLRGLETMRDQQQRGTSKSRKRCILATMEPPLAPYPDMIPVLMLGAFVVMAVNF